MARKTDFAHQVREAVLRFEAARGIIQPPYCGQTPASGTIELHTTARPVQAGYRTDGRLGHPIPIDTH